MHEPVETIHSEEHEGWKVEIFQDWDAESPASWDTFGTLVAFRHRIRNYSIGNREADGTEEDALDRGGTRLLQRYLRLACGWEAIPFAFQDYGSSGCRVYDIDWDNDRADGFIYADRDEIQKEFDGDVARARECLKSELAAWDTYFQGDVYGYVVEDPDGNHRDSCWGFYGFEYACTEAREQLEWAIRHEAEELLKISRAVAL